MKILRLTMALMALFCLTALSGCNKDDNGNEPDDGTGSGTIIPGGTTEFSVIGSWEFLGEESEENEHIKKLTFYEDGSIAGTWKEKGLDKYSNFKGTYTRYDNNLTLHANWDDGDHRTWMFSILAIDASSMSLEMQQGSKVYIMYFKRVFSTQN